MIEKLNTKQEEIRQEIINTKNNIENLEKELETKKYYLIALIGQHDLIEELIESDKPEPIKETKEIDFNNITAKPV